MTKRGAQLAREALESGKTAESAWEDMQARNASADWDVDRAIRMREVVLSRFEGREWVGITDQTLSQETDDEDRPRHTE